MRDCPLKSAHAPRDVIVGPVKRGVGNTRRALGLATLALAAGAGCGDDRPQRQGPELRRSFELAQPAGRVLVRLCDGRRVRLRETMNVAFGCTVIDARRGSVTVITARDRTGRTQRARFNAGVFRVTQEPDGLTELILAGDVRECSAPSRRRTAVPEPDADGDAGLIRRLLGDGTGRFRTRGNFASATVRGTRWGTQDFCHGTLVVVREGRIAVRDLVRDRTIEVTAPDILFVRAPG